MTNSQINRVSGRKFENLLDCSWVARSQEDQDDYGIDFELEVIGSDEVPKGSPFKVQLKGVENGQYRKDGALVFADASCKKFEYYIQRLQLPLIFVIYDIGSKRCFWRAIQGSKDIESQFKLAQEKNQKTFTLEFFDSDEFTNRQDCQNEVLGAVSRMVDVIALRRVERIPLGAVQDITSLSDDPLQIVKSLKRVASYATISSIQQLYETGRRDDAEHLSEELFRNPHEELEIRLHSGQWYLKCKRFKIFEEKLPEMTQLNRELQLNLATEMLKISRQTKGPWALRFYQRCFWRSSLLALDSYFLQSLFITDAVRLGGADWFSPIIRVERERRFDRISRCFASVMNEINVALDRNQYAMIPNVWTDCAMAAKSFSDACHAGHKMEYFIHFRDSLDAFFPLAIYISQFAGRDDEARIVLIQCCVQFLGLSDFSSTSDIDQRVVVLNTTLKEHVDNVLISSIEREISSVIARIKSYTSAETLQKQANETDENQSFLKGQIIAQATAVGVDMNDPNSEDAKLVKIGLKDADPTRVLKHCVHMHVTPDSPGMIGQMLGLSTAGFKQVHCLKHGHSSGGLCLDQTYQFFKGESPKPWGKKVGHSCLVCKDKEHHGEGWLWDHNWQKQQHAKYKG